MLLYVVIQYSAMCHARQRSALVILKYNQIRSFALDRMRYAFDMGWPARAHAGARAPMGCETVIKEVGNCRSRTLFKLKSKLSKL